MLHNYKYSTISEQRELRYRFTPVIGAVKKSYASNETEMYVRVTNRLTYNNSYYFNEAEKYSGRTF